MASPAYSDCKGWNGFRGQPILARFVPNWSRSASRSSCRVSISSRTGTAGRGKTYTSGENRVENVAVLARTEEPSRVASLWHTLLVLGVEVVLSVRGFMRANHAASIPNPDRLTIYQHTIFFQW